MNIKKSIFWWFMVSKYPNWILAFFTLMTIFGGIFEYLPIFIIGAILSVSFLILAVSVSFWK